MLDESTFLAALATQSDDTVTRLAYADWLDENDQLDKARFLRAECELHGTVVERRRLERLAALGEPLPSEWLASVGRPRMIETVWVHRSESRRSAINTSQPTCGLYFRADGVVFYFYPNSPSNPTPGRWKQFGPRLVYHIDQGQSGTPYSFHTARIDGEKLRVSSRNIGGMKWRWSVELSPQTPPPGRAPEGSRSRRGKK